jgi:hypothetical protein
MAHDVFVSYSHKDKPVADAVVAGLENRSVRCWIAPRDVTPGTSWGQAIIDAIEGSIVMIVILSGNSNQSRQVVREVERAVAKGVVIIPLRIEDIHLTGAMAYFLSTEHWLDALTPPLEEHINKLVNTVQLFLSKGEKEILEERLSKPVHQPMPTHRRRQPVSPWMVVSGIAIVVIVAIAIFPGLTGKSPPEFSETQTPPLPPTEILPSPTPTLPPPPEFGIIGEYRTSGSAYGLFVADNILTLANGENGLVRLQIADPTEPKLVDTFWVSDLPAQRLVVDNQIAYVIVGDHARNLVIMELGPDGKSTTFPADGRGMGGLQSLYNVTVAGGLAHLTGHNYWGILDVKDPLQPEEIWTWEPPSHSGNPCNAAIKDNIAFIGCGWAGLFIFDITDPSSPHLIGSYNTPNWIIDIKIREQILYLTLGESGLLSLDISDPTRPLLIDQVNLPGFSTRLSVTGNYAYVVYLVYDGSIEQPSGVVAVDLRDPQAMELIATYDKIPSGSDIQAVEDVVIVADQLRGVTILRLDLHE